MGDGCWAQHTTNEIYDHCVTSRGMFYYNDDHIFNTGKTGDAIIEISGPQGVLIYYSSKIHYT